MQPRSGIIPWADAATIARGVCVILVIALCVAGMRFGLRLAHGAARLRQAGRRRRAALPAQAHQRLSGAGPWF
jgi:hypothetical protein